MEIYDVIYSNFMCLCDDDLVSDLTDCIFAENHQHANCSYCTTENSTQRDEVPRIILFRSLQTIRMPDLTFK